LRSVLVQGELSPADLDGLLATVGATRQAAAAYALGASRVTILVGSKFYFRSNDYLGVVIAAVANGTSQRIDVSYAGGGSGLLGIQLGAGDSLEEALFTALVGVLQSRSLRFGDPESAGAGPSAPLP
jgi:hypothetical protein